jgi:hypothetical protein
MAELARDYHYNLQNHGGDISDALREAAMQEAFSALPQTDLGLNMTPLHNKLKEEDIAMTLGDDPR